MKAFSPPSFARHRQAGFTMIELMVAVAIALFIAAGLTILFLNTHSTFSTQDKFSQLQDSQRLAIIMLTTTTQTAGYFVDPLNNTVDGALPASALASSDGTTFMTGQGISGTGSSTGTGSDTLNVRYQTASGDGVMNCLGVSNPPGSGAPVIWVNSFAINASNELTCSVNGGAVVPLVSNVVKMSILYGVDADDDGNIDSYLNATAISNASLWSNVQTAQFSLSFIDPTSSRPGFPVPLPNPWIQTVSLMNHK